MDNSHVNVTTNNFKENDIKSSMLSSSKKDLDIVDNNNTKTAGLFNVRAFIFLALWYLFSGCTLFLNKYILTYLNGNPTILGK